MKRILSIATGVALVVLAGLLAAAPAAQAQAQQDIYSPVILSSSGTYSTPIQMRENGSGIVNIALTGDLTHNGFKGRRYFVRAEPVLGQGLPDGSQYSDYVAYNENGAPATRVVLTSDPSMHREARFIRSAYWSVDGRRLAYYGKRFDLATGTVLAEGIFVADVAWDSVSGAPTGVTAETLAVPIPADPDEQLGTIPTSWSWDSRRFTYNATKYFRDASGNIIGSEMRMYIAQVVDTVPPSWSAPVRIHVANPAGSEFTRAFTPKFSPAAGDTRLAFWGTPYRNGGCSSGLGGSNSIWTVSVPDNYDGSYMLLATEITTTTNTRSVCAIGYEEWSPDGVYVVFTGMPPTYTGRQLYKLRADGSAKAVALTSNKKIDYGPPQWRR